MSNARFLFQVTYNSQCVSDPRVRALHSAASVARCIWHSAAHSPSRVRTHAGSKQLPYEPINLAHMTFTRASAHQPNDREGPFQQRPQYS